MEVDVVTMSVRIEKVIEKNKKMEKLSYFEKVDVVTMSLRIEKVVVVTMGMRIWKLM